TKNMTVIVATIADKIATLKDNNILESNMGKTLACGANISLIALREKVSGNRLGQGHLLAKDQKISITIGANIVTTVKYRKNLRNIFDFDLFIKITSTFFMPIY